MHMIKKRNFVLLLLLGLIVFTFILLRTSNKLMESRSYESPVLIDAVEVSTTTENKEVNDNATSSEVISSPVYTNPDSGSEEKPVPAQNTACYVGGCSGQICSERSDIVSTCEWRETYACYRKAVCERQSSGECGWTETEELNSCLIKAELEAGLEVM